MASAVLALLATPSIASAQILAYDIPSESLSQALRDYGRESRRQIVFKEDLVRGRTSQEWGTYSADVALTILLSGTDLVARVRPSGAIMIQRKPPPNVPRTTRKTDDSPTGADQGEVARSDNVTTQRNRRSRK